MSPFTAICLLAHGLVISVLLLSFSSIQFSPTVSPASVSAFAPTSAQNTDLLTEAVDVSFRSTMHCAITSRLAAISTQVVK